MKLLRSSKAISKKENVRILVGLFWIIFAAFWWFSKFSESKWSVIISNKPISTGCLTSYRTTQDLGSEEIRKYQEIIKPQSSSQNKNSASTSKKPPVVRYSTWKLEFVPNILRMIVEKIYDFKKSMFYLELQF